MKELNNYLFSKIIKIFFTYKFYILLLILFSIIFISIGIIKPYVLSLLFDIGITGKSFNNILKYTFYFFLIMIISALLTIINQYFVVKFANEFIYKIRMLILTKILNLPIKFYENNSTGDIITRIDADVQDIRNYLLFDLFAFYQSLLSFIAASMFIGFMQWRILAANLLILPILALVLLYFKSKLYKCALELKNSISQSNKELVDGFMNITELKSSNFETYFLKNISNKFKIIIIKSIKNRILQQLSSSSIQFVVNLTYLIVVGYGGYLIIQNLMTSGLLLAFLTMRSQLVSPIQSWSNLYTRFFTVKASLDRLNEYYTQENEKGLEKKIDVPFNIRKYNSLIISNIIFDYNDTNTPALINCINLDFRSGKWIGIKGKSGSGKTTLIKLLLKLEIQKKGSILWNDSNIEKFNNRKWRNIIGYISQKSLALNTTVENNILMGRRETEKDKIWKILKVCELEKEIKRLPNGMQTCISEKGSQFSGGMVKRLMLARSIFDYKSIIILDEFFSSLDVKLSKKIMINLKKYLPSNAIIIIISHRDCDFEMCNQVIEINKNYPNY